MFFLGIFDKVSSSVVVNILPSLTRLLKRVRGGPSLTWPLIYIKFLESLTFFMERYYVYILFSLRDKKFYTGFTTNLKDRLSRHTRGEIKLTANRKPLRLIHYEYFINEQDARAREVFLKSGFGRNQLKQALKRTLL